MNYSARTSLKSEGSKRKTPILLTVHYSYWEKVLWTMKLKRNCLVIITGTMFGGTTVTLYCLPQNIAHIVKFGCCSTACCSTKGVGRMTMIDGKVYAEIYQEILQENLMTSADKLGFFPDLTCQQENNLI